MAEALADARRRHEERVHDNQPEWTRGTRGAQEETTARRESESPAGVKSGDTTNSRGGREVTAREKKRDTARGGGATRGGQVEAPPDGSRWRDEKL